jgi:hypothetical protein
LDSIEPPTSRIFLPAQLFCEATECPFMYGTPIAFC